LKQADGAKAEIAVFAGEAMIVRPNAQRDRRPDQRVGCRDIGTALLWIAARVIVRQHQGHGVAGERVGNDPPDRDHNPAWLAV
jgi:hypothetical protein